MWRWTFRREMIEKTADCPVRRCQLNRVGRAITVRDEIRHWHDRTGTRTSDTRCEHENVGRWRKKNNHQYRCQYETPWTGDITIHSSISSCYTDRVTTTDYWLVIIMVVTIDDSDKRFYNRGFGLIIVHDCEFMNEKSIEKKNRLRKPLQSLDSYRRLIIFWHPYHCFFFVTTENREEFPR